MRRLLIALGFMTRLPVPHVVAAPEDFAAAIRLYPLVGIVIGAIVAGAGIIASQVDPWWRSCCNCSPSSCCCT